MKNVTSKIRLLLALAGNTLIFSANAFAVDGTTMPWENPLKMVRDSVTGPIATALATVIIIMCGLGLTMGEGSGGTRKLLWAGMGLSITLGAASLMGTLFGSTGVAF